MPIAIGQKWQASATLGRVAALSAAAFVVSTVACSAGPCSPQIDAMQARLDARIAAAEAAAPLAPESRGALLHHQPTPRSLASALIALGVLSPEKAKSVGDAMARARKADHAGNTTACEQALAEIDRTIGP